MSSTQQSGAPVPTVDVDRSDPAYRTWLKEAVHKVQADANRSADTHLLRFPIPEEWGVDLYLKDESTHPTGSLKHRLARSLFLYGLCNGWIRPESPVIEASSGSTAVSEAYFAQLIGVPFIAVMPRTTSREKCRLIEFRGGSCHFVDDPRAMYTEAAALAERTGGHYIDQFTYAERATDWRGNNNIAESIHTDASSSDLRGCRKEIPMDASYDQVRMWAESQSPDVLRQVIDSLASRVEPSQPQPEATKRRPAQVALDLDKPSGIAVEVEWS